MKLENSKLVYCLLSLNTLSLHCTVCYAGAGRYTEGSGGQLPLQILKDHLTPQSKYPALRYRSAVLGAFDGIGFLFLGHLGSRASRVKKWGANYEQLLRAVFSCFQGQKKYFLSFLKTL
jgi:hypothetical protein